MELKNAYGGTYLLYCIMELKNAYGGTYVTYCIMELKNAYGGTYLLYNGTKKCLWGNIPTV